MKKIRLITGFLILTLITQAGWPMAMAAEDPMAAEKACQAKKPDYAELLKIWSDAEVQDQDAYQEAFDAAQEAHHLYVGCIFNFAEATVLLSDGSEDSGTMDANTLNTGGIPIFSSLVDLMTPDQACLTPDKLKEIIQATNPTQIMTPVLDAYSKYKNHLNTIGTQFENYGMFTNEQGEALGALSNDALQNTLTRQRKLEIESSLLAIDLMFTSLKELRFSFVMHVHFQCTLKYLEKYRKKLADLRVMIEALPSLLKDASVSK